MPTTAKAYDSRGISSVNCHYIYSKIEKPDIELTKEDYYASLNCQSDVKYEDLKKIIRFERLKCHPDKTISLDSKSQQTMSLRFLEIERAWRVLSSEESRKNYDAILAINKLKADPDVNSMPIQNDIPITSFVDEMGCIPEYMKNYEYHLTPDDAVFTHPCRCGSDYTLDAVSVISRSQFAFCSDCSLVVRVLYPKKDSQTNLI